MSHAHEPPEPPALYAVRDDLDTDEPHDLPAEQAVIGSMLLSTQAITDATDTLYGTEFYRHAHELIWRATTPRSSATAPPAAPCAQPAAASTTSPEPPAPEASMR
jgi:hypothetical protein